MHLSWVLSIWLSVLFLFSQQEIKLVQELTYITNEFNVDQLGYLYLVNGSELRKVDTETKKERSFSSLSSGSISSVDVSDPFQSLVFYQDFNKVLWLDKYLSPIASSISLDELGFYQVAAVCQSVDGGFWVFDQSLYQLVYIDKNLRVVNKSNQFSEMIDQNIGTGEAYMLEKNDYIYLGINGSNIMQFDSYGTYVKTFPVNYHERFDVNNQTIIYFDGVQLNYYNTNNYVTERFALPDIEIEQVIVGNKRIFIQTEGKILVYIPENY